MFVLIDRRDKLNFFDYLISLSHESIWEKYLFFQMLIACFSVSTFNDQRVVGASWLISIKLN